MYWYGLSVVGVSAPADGPSALTSNDRPRCMWVVCLQLRGYASYVENGRRGGLRVFLLCPPPSCNMARRSLHFANIGDQVVQRSAKVVYSSTRDVIVSRGVGKVIALE